MASKYMGARPVSRARTCVWFESASRTTERIAAHDTSWRLLDGNRQVAHQLCGRSQSGGGPLGGL